MNTYPSWEQLLALLAIALPAILAAFGVLGPAWPARRAAPYKFATSTALFLALLFAGGVLGRRLTGSSPEELRWSGAEWGVQLDLSTALMLLLVSGLGWMVTRYSCTYLHPHPRLDHYLRWLLLTLSAVTTVLIASNLLAMALSYTATSLALHQLLTFLPGRTQALVAAHKKFLVSRTADLLLLLALGLVYAEVGSLDSLHLEYWLKAQQHLPWTMQLGALCLVLAVGLRSAQLPFHGWLTQVMEAPTPVSALLHAGIINIGAFLLIRLSSWLDQALLATIVLVMMGSLSLALGALVMTTRISIKLSLAWSTIAQMGFLLLQCGLGLWSLALLHLVSHSVYKAYAFLNAGSKVQEWRLLHSTHSVPASGFKTSLAILLGLGTGAAVLHVQAHATGLNAATFLALLLGLSCFPFWRAALTHGLSGLPGQLLQLLLLVGLYLGWHELSMRLLPLSERPDWFFAWASLCILSLFVLKLHLGLRPQGRLARGLHPWLFAGFYLDEIFTRHAFALWPPKLSPSPRPLKAQLPNPQLESQI